MEETKQSELNLMDLVGILKRCWILMLIVAVVVTLLTYIIAVNTHQDEYTATVGLWAYRSDDGASENISQNYYATILSAQYVDEYMEMVTSNNVVEKVLADQNLTISKKQLLRMVDIKQKDSSGNSTLFYLSVTAASPESAQRLSEAWSRVLCSHINGMTEKNVIIVFDPATMPDEPSNPISLLKILLLAFACAAVVYGIFFVRFLLDDKINSAEDVEKYLDLHVLGAIPDKNQLTRRRSKGAYYAQSGDVKLN